MSQLEEKVIADTATYAKTYYPECECEFRQQSAATICVLNAQIDALMNRHHPNQTLIAQKQHRLTQLCAQYQKAYMM